MRVVGNCPLPDSREMQERKGAMHPRSPLMRAFFAFWVAAGVLVCSPTAGALAAYPLRVVEVSRTNSQHANNASYFGVGSKDGRYVAFQSWASNLAGGGVSSDVFWRDTRTGITKLVSSGVGTPSDGYSHVPAIDESGRYVAFSSVASNLVAGDANGAYDVFLWDQQSGTTTRVSLSSLGDGDSHSPSISASGRYVAFVSGASDLVANDTAGHEDVFVRDTVAGTTTRVSVSASGVEALGDSSAPSISASGRYVAFSSRAANLVSGDTNNANDVFVYDTSTRALRRVSVSSAGKQAELGSFAPAISGNGLRVVFESRSSNLVSGDTNGARDVFLRDLAKSTTQRVSIGASGAGSSDSEEPSISYDGTKVAFTSESALVTQDTNRLSDLYLRDLKAGSTHRLSTGYRGAQAGSPSAGGAITPDGRNVLFHTAAALTSGDGNKVVDVLRASFGPRPIERVGASTSSLSSVRASARTRPSGSCDVVIVNSSHWYEALSGSSLCGASDASLLYVSRTSLSTPVMHEIVRLKPARIWVIGPTSSVSTPVFELLKATAPSARVTRVGGKDRYATSAAVASLSVKLMGSRSDHSVLVASGASYNGAVAGASIAAATGRPFVLVNPKTGRYKLPSGTKRALILGTTKAVTKSVSKSLTRRLGKGKVKRIGSSDRNVMAAAVAKYAVSSCRMTYDRLTIANLARRAESVSGAVMAGRCGAVVLGTSAKRLPSKTRTRLAAAASRIDLVRIAGTSRSVSTSTSRAIRRALGG